MIVDRRTALLMLAGSATSCRASAAIVSAARRDLYNCEGCEAVRERDAGTLRAYTILAGPDEPGERLQLSGRVLALDGSPAPGVVIYAHHTNAAGHYANGTSETEWSRRHGRLRGWARSDAQGDYAFRTIKPAPYPDRTLPAHIHLFVGEPGCRPYYLDDVVFAGEFGVTSRYIDAQELRGGSGIVRLRRQAHGLLLATRDIRLEPHPA